MLIGNETIIENLKKEKMLKYLTKEFKKSPNMGKDVYVNIFQDGYLVVDENRMAKINMNGSVGILENSTYILSTDDEWKFSENSDGTVTLIAYNKEIKGEIVIPTEVKNKETKKVYTVTGLGNELFNYGSNITNVDMSSAIGLKTIGSKTFANCSNLEINIPSDLPNSIEKLGDNAFWNCTNLVGNIDEILATKIVLGRGTFANCPKLTGSIQNVFNQIFYIQEDGTPSQTTILEGQFSGFSGLTGELVIPNYITEIGNNAFSNCEGITSLSFEEGSTCTKIGNYAFYQTKGMKSNVIIPNSVTEIGANSFRESEITGVTLSSNLKTLGSEAFYKSKISGTLTIPKTLKRVSSQSFYETNIATLNFETDGTNGTQIIANSAFIYNKKLETINLPSTLTNIETWSFLGDSAITSISLPDSLTTIGERTFEGCNKMIITHWPINLKTLAKQTFNGCNSLTSMPDTTSLISIGEECFINCTSLGKVANNGTTDIIKYLQNSKITTIGSACFKNCGYLNGNYTGEIKNKNNQAITIGSSAFAETKVIRSAEFSVTGTTIAANAYNGVTEFKQNGSVITQIAIPSGVTSIGTSAFAGCTNVTSITIPNTVKTIGTNAFQNCTNLQKVIFESGNTQLTNIPNYCFDGCSQLNLVENIPENVTSIENYSFYNCKKLTTIVLPDKIKTLGNSTFMNSGLTTIELPQNLTSIGSSCFRVTNITKITIPDSVTNIANSIFERSKLEEITLGKGITSTSSYLFIYCYNLKKVTFRGEIKSIGLETFNECTQLQLSGINGLDWKKLTNIGSNAFKYCKSLTGKVQLSSNCTVDSTALTNCPLVFYK